MTEFEKRVFGMSKDDIRTQYMESLTANLSGLEMVVMSIMSDCQELIAMKSPTCPAPSTDELIRKQLNIAKHILCEMMDAKREKETV